MKDNLLIIGAGQLGSRHLQALAQLDDKFSIYVLDPSEQSLDVAKQRYQEVAQEASPGVTYVTDMESIAGLSVEVAIVATNAAVRLGIVKQLVEKLTVKYLVLEKVLFQSIAQLIEAEKLLADAGVKTWVNCPRRQFPAYQALAQQYQGAKSVALEVTGSNWGLGCNAIHFIDLWNYLAGFSNYDLDFQADVSVIDSKRSGYKELVGGLSARADQHKLCLRCDQTESGQVMVDISVVIDGEHIELSEREGAVRWLEQDGETVKESPLQIFFQSQLSNKVVLDLINKQDCELTALATSNMLHEEFLRKAVPIFDPSARDELEQLVPIT
ncbi:Gfo/Idh/MocA family oxidoreductase [Vibrio sp. 10N.247.311.12]|uniref:Gfo/Idh/MocA family oxidoreductase n=1 Tax=Vibrio sp. 10N.247.311.12 TaxID=3229991 RepID=UPI00354B499C